VIGVTNGCSCNTAVLSRTSIEKNKQRTSRGEEEPDFPERLEFSDISLDRRGLVA
jgi:hypothetical protein